VLKDGALLGWIGRGDHPLLTFLPDEQLEGGEGAGALASALAQRVDERGLRALLVSTIDGVPAARSPLAPAFLEAGFTPSAQGLLRRARQAPPEHDSPTVET
jgi:hypothetical protein